MVIKPTDLTETTTELKVVLNWIYGNGNQETRQRPSSPEGPPIGVQIVAHPWREDVALALALSLEAASGGQFN